jgi:hypothetical protein
VQIHRIRVGLEAVRLVGVDTQPAERTENGARRARHTLIEGPVTRRPLGVGSRREVDAVGLKRRSGADSVVVTIRSYTERGN